MIKWQDGQRIHTDVIADFESRHEITLPATYKAVVMAHDGGRPIPGSIAYDGPGEWVRLSGLIPFRNPDDDRLTMEATLLRRPYGIPEYFVPFGSDGGGYLFFFWYEPDLRVDPPIGVFRNDVPGGEAVPVAPDFDTFLDLLTNEETVTPPL